MQKHEPPFRLREFKVEVTYRCTLNCVHCSSDARPSNSLEMSLADCVRILREAASLGAKEVALSGGEPMDWLGISDAVSTAVSLGLKTTVYTSGNATDFADKARTLRQIGVERFVFSLFGGTDATHERVTRIAGSFRATCQAVQSARQAGLEAEIHFVPMTTNYRELAGIAALAKRCGAHKVSVLRLVPQGRAALLKERVLNRVQNLELRQAIQDLRQSGFNIRVGSPYNFLMLNDKPGCWAAIDRIIIGPDLRFYPCDAFKRMDATQVAGTEQWSDLSVASVADCWEKSPYLQAVRAYLMSDFEDPCASCGYLERCVSGCLAQKAVVDGSLTKRPDPDCLGPSFAGRSR